MVFILARPARVAWRHFECYLDAHVQPTRGILFAGLIASVNPFVGTDGKLSAAGMTTPAAQAPHGLVRLGPDTAARGGTNELWSRISIPTSGYAYWHNRIVGFSHTHLSGTGLREGGQFRFIPSREIDSTRAMGGKLILDHALESASPGLYSIRFKKERFQAELIATENCGIQRYTNEDLTRPLFVHFDAQGGLHSGMKAENLSLQAQDSSSTFRVQFRAESAFLKLNGGLPFFAIGQRLGDFVALDETALHQKRPAVRFTLPPGGRGEIRLCLSLNSASAAKTSLETQTGENSFEEVLNSTRKKWSSLLDRIQIESDEPEVLTNFATAAYRTFASPTLYSDSAPTVPGPEGRPIEIRQNSRHFSELSLWDTFRTTHPWYTLVSPELQRDVIQSLLRLGKALDRLPRWPYGRGDLPVMIGAPANFLFSETYLKGLGGFDPQEALPLLEKSFLRMKEHPDWLPSERVDHSVSETLELSWAASVTSDFARAIQASPDRIALLEKQSNAFKNLWDPRRKFFGPRHSRGFFEDYQTNVMTNLDLTLIGRPRFYAEGSAHQWRYSVPHQPHTLISLFGGAEKFTQELEGFLKGASPRMADPWTRPAYWHGNEHDFHAAWLFIEAGHPELTQRWVRWILDHRYAPKPLGLDGNDDAGALSAWYTLASLGLYPQAGTDRYWVSAPRVREAKLNLGLQNGQERFLKIRTHNQSRENAYLQRVTLNGQCLTRAEISHSELLDAVLAFELGPEPVPGGGFTCSH